MRSRIRSATAVGWVVALAMSAGMAAAAERLYDRDVAKIIDRANDDLGKFLGNMKSDAKGAKVTRGGAEYDVSDYLSDLKEEGARLEERFSGDGKASPNATAFLQKAKGFDGFVDRHPGFTGADKQWQALRPTLQSLADAYEVDWSGDLTTWQATRYSDAEVGGLAKQLDSDIKSYSAVLTKAAKERQGRQGGPGRARRAGEGVGRRRQGFAEGALRPHSGRQRTQQLGAERQGGGRSGELARPRRRRLFGGGSAREHDGQAIDGARLLGTDGAGAPLVW